jgi:hypothetical protein
MFRGERKERLGAQLINKTLTYLNTRFPPTMACPKAQRYLIELRVTVGRRKNEEGPTQSRSWQRLTKVARALLGSPNLLPASAWSTPSHHHTKSDLDLPQIFDHLIVLSNTASCSRPTYSKTDTRHAPQTSESPGTGSKACQNWL